MIKLNLTPIEELENQNWWVPDVIGVTLFFVLGAFVGLYSEEVLKSEVQNNISKESQFESNYQGLKGDLDRFEDLSKSLVKLQAKKESLLLITSSRVTRYLQIIIVENLQNLRPEGLWFNSIEIKSKEKEPQQEVSSQENAQVENIGSSSQKENAVQSGPIQGSNGISILVKGTALSNTLVAKFMTNLQDTLNQEIDPNNLRSQIVFDNVIINSATSKKIRLSEIDEDGIDAVDFSLSLEYVEKSKNLNLKQENRVSISASRKTRL